MVSSCAAYGCSYRHTGKNGYGLFRFPKDPIRNKMWIIALKRKDWNPTNTSRLCGRHFVTGRPSTQPSHPDYIPSLFDFTLKTKPQRGSKKRLLVEPNDECHDATEPPHQYLARSGREKTAPIVVEIISSKVEVENSETNTEPQSEDSITAAASMELDNLEGEEDPCNEVDSLRKTSADLNAIVVRQEFELKTLRKQAESFNNRMSSNAKEIETLKNDKSDSEAKMEEYRSMVSSRDTEIYNLRAEMDILRQKATPFAERILRADCEFSFYTGLQSKKAFEWLKQVMTDTLFDFSNCSINAETQLLMVLVKLKLNLHLSDISFKFDVSNRTVGRVLEIWIPVMAGKLESLVRWPERETMQKHLPLCFKNSIYKDTVAIIDCIEILIQKPANIEARNQTYSRDRKHHTIKFMVCVSPNGYISSVSNLWGGNSSEEEIIYSSGFLDNLLPLDIILANREFQIEDELTEIGAKLLIPSQTREAIHVPSLGDPNNDHNVLRNIENIIQQTESDVYVNICMERLIDRIKQFTILKSQVPITFLKYMDSAVIVCAALCNLNASIEN